MAKNDNIQDLLHDVADAIREKKGTTDKINPQDFSDEIRGIESGGGTSVAEGDVTMRGTGIRAITSVTIPDGEFEIGQSAFAGMANLTSINIPSSIVRLQPYSFQACYSLTDILLPNGVTSIGAYAFQNASKLTSVNIPSSLVDFGGGYTFINCTSLSSAMCIPATVVNIPAATFNNCPKIPVFDFSSHTLIPTLAHTNAFERTNGTIVVPDSLYDQWKAATNWSTYASRIVKASEFVEPTT